MDKRAIIVAAPTILAIRAMLIAGFIRDRPPFKFTRAGGPFDEDGK
jgi:hypothetical protein